MFGKNVSNHWNWVGRTLRVSRYAGQAAHIGEFAPRIGSHFALLALFCGKCIRNCTDPEWNAVGTPRLLFCADPAFEPGEEFRGEFGAVGAEGFGVLSVWNSPEFFRFVGFFEQFLCVFIGHHLIGGSMDE